MKKELYFTSQARAFVESLPESARTKAMASFALLASQGFLRAPYAEKVEGKDNLFEVRVKDSAGQVRVFYAYIEKDAIWALSGFVKKAQKTPLSEVRKALKIKKEIEK